MVESALPDALRSLREGRGLSLGAASRRAGIAASSLQGWETGRRTPKGRALELLLIALGADEGTRARLLAETDPRHARTALAHSPLGSPVHVGQALRSLRACARVTQAELALRAGVTQGAVAKWETGATRPADEALDRALVALGASPEEASWVRRLAREEPTPLQDLDEAQAWLDAHRPDVQDPGVAPLLAFERTVWGHAARDPRWEPLLAETVSWRCLAHLYTHEWEARQEAARGALALARASGAWDRVRSAVLARYGPRNVRSLGSMERTFEEYVARVGWRIDVRDSVRNELSWFLMDAEPGRAEALAQTTAEVAPPLVTARFNDATVRDDGLSALIEVRYRRGDLEGAVALYGSMDCVRAGRPTNFLRAHANYIAAAYRLGARDLPETETPRWAKRPSAHGRYHRDRLDRELERHA